MFGSRPQDPATGLINMRARWYSPDIGRFLSPDPAGLVDGTNLYAYAQNDPVNFFDPTGLARVATEENPGLGTPPFVLEVLAAHDFLAALEGAGLSLLAFGGGVIEGFFGINVGGPGGPLAEFQREHGYGLLLGAGLGLIADAAMIVGGGALMLGGGGAAVTVAGVVIAIPAEVVGAAAVAAGATAAGAIHVPNFKEGLNQSEMSGGDKTDGGPSGKKPPKPSPKFQEPTNPPQNPPKDIPEGWRVREMPPTEQYPSGYWKLEKPMKDGSWQPIDPSTMKPGTRPQTHVPFPPKKSG